MSQRNRLQKDQMSGEHDPQVGSYSHLNYMPRGEEALFRLKKIASMAKPIMRNHGWKLPVLAEFYPEQPNLLGINENRGSRICLRLRYPGDPNQFLPIEQVIDTFLHELSHNEVGPHNEKFHALWNTLRKEYDDLISKGYTGEGFLSKGHKLGGRRVPMQEVQRKMRDEAEKRRRREEEQRKSSGRRLGGDAPSPWSDIRSVIASAAESRQSTRRPAPKPPTAPLPEACGNAVLRDQEVTEIANTAISSGFRTKAEENEANDAAIARLLWEMEHAARDDTPVAGPGEWVCPQCTLLNPRAVWTCQACEFTVPR